MRRLTDDPAHDWDPAWSPDGKKIVWSSSRSGNLEIWESDPEGAGAHQVSHDGMDAENPGLTTDGWVVYVSGNPAKRGVWKVREDGSQPAQIASGVITFPDLSPDAKYLAFRRDGRLHVLTIADGKPTFEFPGTGRMRWTSDGRGIASVRRTGTAQSRLAIQPFVPGGKALDLPKPIAALGDSLLIESFAFSPDGKRVVVSAQEQSSSILLVEKLPGISRLAGKID